MVGTEIPAALASAPILITALTFRLNLKWLEGVAIGSLDAQASGESHERYWTVLQPPLRDIAGMRLRGEGGARRRQGCGRSGGDCGGGCGLHGVLRASLYIARRRARRRRQPDRHAGPCAWPDDDTLDRRR